MAAFWFVRTFTTADSFVPTQAATQERFNRDVSDAFAGLAGGHGFAGEYRLFESAKARTGLVLCDGQAVQRASYPELFDIMGTAYGGMAPVFNLPTQTQVRDGITAATSPPTQTIEGGAVASGTTPVGPTTPGQAGGTSGGPVDSGGRAPKGDEVWP